MWASLVLASALISGSYAAPSFTSKIRWDKRSELPQVTFPDATYQATNYNSATDIYTFSNIRFAAPPVGDLRWAKPAPAPKNSTLQDGSYGNACTQAVVNGLNFFGSGSDLPVGTAVDEFLNKLAAPFESGGTEDCLFLDVYVPGSAIRSPQSSNLPVIHWIYGGGYVLGSKNQLQNFDLPFYDGSGLVTNSNNSAIVVASNYRLGAFGFLGGTTMEQSGLPNAGLWDQRAALQWTRDNIATVGGNPNSVTAMGESAGASSLMHHLVNSGGQQDPLFNRAILMSPAFEPIFDRRGLSELAFQNFSSIAGCSGSSDQMSCLRGLDTQTLIDANNQFNGQALPGTFAVGPVPDGSYIRQSPALELASGNFWKGLDGVLVSHTSDESTLFVDGEVSTDSDLTQFIQNLFPTYAKANGLDNAVINQYPPVDSSNSPYDTEGDRVRALIRDSSFTCNTRFLLSAYSGLGVPSYAMEYAVTPGWHATDLLPAFWSQGFSSSVLGDALELALPLLSLLSTAYKSYFTSFAVSGGDPNKFRAAHHFPSAIEWPQVDMNEGGQQIGNVLEVGDLGFSTISDDQNEADSCNFWVQWLSAVTQAGGYSPPGVSVPDGGLISSPANPSANYTTPSQ